MYDNSLKKIAFVSPGYKPVPDVAGGAVEHLMTQIIEANELNPKFIFELWTISDKRLDSLNLQYTHIHQVKNFRKTFFLRAFSLLLNILYTKILKNNKRFNYLGLEVVKHLQSDIDFILVENDVNVFKQIRNKLPQVKMVFHMHNDFDTFGEIQKDKKSMQFIVDNADEIWTVSAYLKRHLLSVFQTDKIRILDNCIDRERFIQKENSNNEAVNFRKKYGISDKSFVVLYTGRILPQKGILELIRAATLLPKELDFKIVIVGDIDTAPISYKQDLINSATLIKGKVVFTGYIQQYEIQNAYAASDIVTIPSQCQEAFCLVALEASCHCKACIASKSGALVDVLSEDSAILLDLDNDFEKKLRDSIYLLATNPELRMNLAVKAYNYSKKFPDRIEYFNNFSLLVNEFCKK